MKKLRSVGILLVSCTIFFASCQKKEKLFSKEETQQKLDSAVKVKTNYLQKQMHEDLEARSAIEVKPLADSIVKARGL